MIFLTQIGRIVYHCGFNPESGLKPGREMSWLGEYPYSPQLFAILYNLLVFKTP
jgi:hypothetical protein